MDNQQQSQLAKRTMTPLPFPAENTLHTIVLSRASFPLSRSTQQTSSTSALFILSSIHKHENGDPKAGKERETIVERMTQAQNKPARSANGSLPCGCWTCCCCGCCGAPCTPPAPVPTGLIGLGVDGSMICPNCDDGLD